MSWSTNDILSQAGKLVVITGATGGLGYETALALAGAGAEVVLTGRNPKKGADALEKIHAIHKNAKISFEQLDLSSLRSVADFATAFTASHDRLDVLVNNAGVMALPARRETSDGFELQLGTNYLGHFALTAQLLPLLSAARARVVTLSSIAARRGSIHFDDLQLKAGYAPQTAYGQSKLACLMFARELQRRSDAGGFGLTSLGAHPGVALTDLIENGMGRDSMAARMKPVLGLLFQTAAAGALPTLYAATSPEVVPGGYYGPDGFMEIRGTPKDANVPAQARDAVAAARLWDLSEQLTHAHFPQLQAAA
jgi:NAD(P)-dependent dehydrogenase (short-subunit alcohol dehydrogenase family)